MATPTRPAVAAPAPDARTVDTPTPEEKPRRRQDIARNRPPGGCSTPASTMLAMAGALKELADLVTRPSHGVEIREIAGYLARLARRLPPADGGPERTA